VFPVISSEVAGFFCLYTSRLKCYSLLIYSMEISALNLLNGNIMWKR